MNRIIVRIASEYNEKNFDLDKIVNKLLPKLVKHIQKNVLVIDNIKNIEKSAKDINDIYYKAGIQTENYIYDYLTDTPIKLNKNKIIKLNYQHEFFNDIYNKLKTNLMDEYIYPFIRSYLNTITTAQKLFDTLTEANILNKFIISLISNSSFITVNLKKLLKNNKQIKPTLLSIINLHILEANEENCQLINQGLAKQYQQQLSNILSNGWNTAYINISTNELKKFLQLIKNENIDITSIINEKIKEAQISIVNNTINSPEELMSTNIKVGQAVKISDKFHDNTHSLSAKPVLYFNGNLIDDNINTNIKLNTDTERLYHKTLLDKYLGNESLHTNDIIKKPITEWRELRDSTENTLVYIFSGEYEAASIIIYKYGIIFYALPKFANKVTSILKSYNKPIFYMNNSANELTKTARRLI